MTKRFTKTIATMIVAAFIFTGCTAKNTAPVTTETIDVTTYTVIDDKEPTITETSKTEDGTTVVITKTTDGTIVSKATVKETETTTTETKATETTPKATETKETKVTETTPQATETTPKATEPTTPEPTETVKPTEPTKEPTKETTKTPTKEPTKPTETTKPTTKPTEPTTKPTTPEPTEPKPTETTPAPITPAPQKYEVVIINSSVGTTSGAGTYKAGDKVTIKATANAGYHFVDWWVSDGNTESTVTKATYTFTMPESDMYFEVHFEKDAEVAPTKPMTYYATADFEVRVGYFDTENVHHEVVLTKSGITVYTTDGRLTGGHFNLYGYNSIRELVEQLFKEYDSSAIMEGYAGVQITNIRDERENP